MKDHQGQATIPATLARGLVFVRTIISYSLSYDAFDITDDDNLATALVAQIQVSIVLVGIVRKPSVEPLVLAKLWGITLQKA